MLNSSKALEALFPSPRRGILTAVFWDPERCWTEDELADHVELPPADLHRELAALVEGGVLLDHRQQPDGACFRANPACPFFAELQGIAAKCASLRGPSGSETILVVDDEPATRKISCILLESWGYRVIEANSAAEAIEIFERDMAAIRLLLTDVIMPEMNGTELAAHLQERNPGLRVLFMSGYTDEELARRHVAFLAKPFNPAGLARKIREELDKV